jgi:Peptidase C13 family
MKSYNELLSAHDSVLRRVRDEAFAALTPATAATHHLSIVPKIYPAGHVLKLVDHEIVVPKDAILVFVDEMPGANFGHPCRYRFHSPVDGRLLDEQRSSFPPEVADPQTIRQQFHGPLEVAFRRPLVYKAIQWDKISLWPWLRDDDNRFALLFTSQISNRRHVEDLEFAWRTLRHRFGFPASHIYVLCYDGTIGATDASAADLATWVGDNTPYQMRIHASATKQHLQDTLNTISGRMNQNSLLFVHTNNHGSPSGLCVNNSSVVTPAEWGTMLAGMSPFGTLVVTMEQCFSGAFSQPTLDHSTAARTSFASAVPADKVSAGAAHFDPWAQVWFEAVNGNSAFGASLPTTADTNHNGRVSVREAFNYSDAHDPASIDDPQYSDQPIGSGNHIYLSRTPLFSEVLREIAMRVVLLEEAFVRPHPPLPDPGPEWAAELLGALTVIDSLAQRIGGRIIREQPVLGHPVAAAVIAPVADAAGLHVNTP